MARNAPASGERPTPATEPRVVQARESVDELKRQLIGLIREKVERNGWNQETASRVLGTWQSKVSLIMSGKLGGQQDATGVSLESLLVSATLVGVNVQLETTPAFIADNYPDPNHLDEIPESLRNARSGGTVSTAAAAESVERAVALMDDGRPVRRSRKVHHSMHVNLVFLTKYPGVIFSEEHLVELEAIMRTVCEGLGVDLVDFDGKTDHVRVLVNFPPNVSITRLTNAIKDETTQQMVASFPDLAGSVYNGSYLWAGSYYASTSGTLTRPTRSAQTRTASR